MHRISSGDESWFPVFDWRGKPNFHKRLKWSFPSGICIEKDPVISASSEMDPEIPDLKEGQISLQRLNAGSSFIAQEERMSESPIETLQKALGLYIISTWGLTFLWHIERHTVSSASKFDDACLFLYIVRNPNITVPTRKCPLVSRLTSRSVRIVLPSLV